jgi:hypothetical protein
VNRKAVVISTIAGLATIAVTASVSAGHTERLPLPAAVNASGASAPGGTGKASPTKSRTTTSTTGAPVQPYTTTTLAPLTGCSVNVSNPAPLRGQTAETVTVTAVPGALASVTANYARTPSRHSAVIGSTGSASFALPIQHAPVGVKVEVTAKVSLRGLSFTCSTSFTPVL